MKASILPFFGKLRLSGSEFDSPHAYLKHLAETQTALADAFYVESRFEQALDAYEKVINIYRLLVEEYSERYLADLAITINNWAFLQGESGNYSVALEAYKEGLEIFRLLNEQNDRDFSPEIAVALNNIALLHLENDNHIEAQKGLTEALGIFKRLAKTEPETFLSDVARISGILKTLCYRQGEKKSLMVEAQV